jgi:hypothetical protein
MIVVDRKCTIVVYFGFCNNFAIHFAAKSWSLSNFLSLYKGTKVYERANILEEVNPQKKPLRLCDTFYSYVGNAFVFRRSKFEHEVEEKQKTFEVARID